MSPSGMDAEAVRMLVKSRDLDRYWSTLFAPQDKRLALLSVYAFHLEVERIPALVSEPMLGQIRLQWWRDTIAGASLDQKTGNPIADVLIQTILLHDLDKDAFFRAIDARSDQVFGDKRQDLNAARGFLHDVEGTIFQLAAAVLDDRSQIVLDACRDAAELTGLLNMIRVPSCYGNLRDSFLEFADTAAAEMGGDRLISAGRNMAPAGKAVLIALARRALARLKASSSGLSQRVRPAFLALAPAGAYLDAAKSTPAVNAPERVSVSPVRRFLILWRASQRRSLLS